MSMLGNSIWVGNLAQNIRFLNILGYFDLLSRNFLCLILVSLVADGYLNMLVLHQFGDGGRMTLFIMNIYVVYSFE